jgi:hypothetical protein
MKLRQLPRIEVDSLRAPKVRRRFADAERRRGEHDVLGREETRVVEKALEDEDLERPKERRPPRSALERPSLVPRRRSFRLILRVGAAGRAVPCVGRRVCVEVVTHVSRDSLESVRKRQRSPAGRARPRSHPARPGPPRGPVSLSVPRRARASPRTKSGSRPTTVDIREPSVSPRRARGAEHTGSTTPAKPRRYAGAHGRDPNRSACSLLRTVLDLLALPPLTTASGSAAAQKLLNVATRASGAMRKGAENSRLLRSDSIPGHQGSSRRQRAHTQDQPGGHSQRRLDRERAIHSCCIKSSLGASSDRGTSTRSSACSSPM